MFILILHLFALSMKASGQSATGRCTYHDYEGDAARFGIAYDNSPPYCGQRYSALQLSNIMAVENLQPGMCNQCYRVEGSPGNFRYILAVDQKGSAGLDIALTSFQALFPGENPLNPQTCTWTMVDPSFCSGICRGRAQECTTGQRNLLPPYLLPSLGGTFSVSSTPDPRTMSITSSSSVELAQLPPSTQEILDATGTGCYAEATPRLFRREENEFEPSASETSTTETSTANGTEMPKTYSSTIISKTSSLPSGNLISASTNPSQAGQVKTSVSWVGYLLICMILIIWN